MKLVVLLIPVFVAFAHASCGSSSYGAAKINSPPCPKSYLFSCQPNLSPAPCAQAAPAASSYGSSGAYTEHVPIYMQFAPQEQLQHHYQQRYGAALIDQSRGGLYEFPGYE